MKKVDENEKRVRCVARKSHAWPDILPISLNRVTSGSMKGTLRTTMPQMRLLQPTSSKKNACCGYKPLHSGVTDIQSEDQVVWMTKEKYTHKCKPGYVR